MTAGTIEYCFREAIGRRQHWVMLNLVPWLLGNDRFQSDELGVQDLTSGQSNSQTQEVGLPKSAWLRLEGLWVAKLTIHKVQAS